MSARRFWAVMVGVALGSGALVAGSSVPATGAGEAPFHNYRVYAHAGPDANVRAWSLRIDRRPQRTLSTRLWTAPGERVLDVARGKVLIRRPGPEFSGSSILVNERGRTRRLAEGYDAVLAPHGASALVMVNELNPNDIFDDAVAYLYRLSDGRRTRLWTDPQAVSGSSGHRFSRDSTTIWMLSHFDDTTYLAEYDLRTREFRRLPASPVQGCNDLEVVPGARLLLSCPSGRSGNGPPTWLVLRQTDLSVVANVRRPGGYGDIDLHGRLQNHLVLFSWRNGNRSALAVLDLRTLTSRRIAGTTGYDGAVTDYASANLR